MTKLRERAADMKKHADKLKEASLSPWRYLLSIVAFIATLFLLPAVFKGSQSIWDALAWRSHVRHSSSKRLLLSK